MRSGNNRLTRTKSQLVAAFRLARGRAIRGRNWGRNDPIQDHVYSNQAFTHKLDEFGIAHEAQEYRGAWAERNWGVDGRIYMEVLPFFRRNLEFDRANDNSRK